MVLPSLWLCLRLLETSTLALSLWEVLVELVVLPVAWVLLSLLLLWVCSWTFDVSLGFVRVVVVMVIVCCILGVDALELLPLMLALVAVVVLLRRCLLPYLPSLKQNAGSSWLLLVLTVR